ncbi:extracellular solute-binding protein [Streptomyces sp. NBC_00825]|uniref:ABC transporter substrate-binding protein n=1 Tax=unclassified Streptomyces TaxID=2593676 RepID=UPI002ED1DE1B|nr:extracellular solute-binding protein [Streptomyces sp. NBC_00826]WTH89422.1 extracellular solute-binding protein [Streptomyces sp. NBC_00825]WTH98149.1 extracellular solute-binding protein [Streptomyces sp. NBC_00822]
MRRRQFLLQTAGLAGTTAALGLTGCSASKDVKLHLLVASYDKSIGASLSDQWDAVAAAFEKQHAGIRIELERVSYTKIDKTLAQRVEEGRAPDIAQSNIFAPYAEDGRLYDMSQLFDIATQADFIRSFTDAGTVRDATYGIPFLASTPRLFYNKELFRRARISGAPTSWDELRASAQALKAIGVKTPYGLQLGPEAAEDEALSWLLAAGGGYTSELAEYDFVKPENVEALTWLRDELVAEGLAGADPMKLNRTDAYTQFMRGEIGMMIGHPMLMGAADQAKLPYAHAAFPKKDGGAAPPVGISDWLMAFRRNDHRKECGAFLSFLYSGKSALTYGGSQSALPVTYSASDAATGKPAEQPLSPFIEQLANAQFAPVNMRSWPAVRGAIRTDVGQAVLKAGEPETVLASLDESAVKADMEAATS